MTGQPALTREEANLAFVERWVELHNTDPLRMVRECYAPDAVIEVPGVESFGVERLRQLELSGPPRSTRVLRTVAAGDVVAVEGTTATLSEEGQGPEVRWCVLLTIRDGVIVSDHAYLNTHQPTPA
ncbi:nuclear transport factor 2 family protein [Lentzea sp. JNUCC 0626]|uniref:nuclear transport factor 2 family protein n=1 Tax=Lentzea sp. JNUCC 0626 TaxID=3367513 RepID=UPI003747BB4C